MLVDKSIPDGEECRCKRLAKIIHCTDCGSRAVERKVRPEVITVNDKKYTVAMYTCRRCGFKFNDMSRLTCNAPLPQLSVRGARVMDSALENLSYEERKKLAFDALKGVKPSAPASIADEIDKGE